MAFRISMDNHNYAMAERAKKAQEENATNMAIKQIASGAGLPGGLFGASGIKGPNGQNLSWIDAAGADGIKKIVEIQKTVTNSAMDPNFGAREQAKSEILKAASSGSDDAIKQLTDALGAGRITTTEYNFYDGLYRNAQDLKKDLPGGSMFLEAQAKVAETILAPKSLDPMTGLMVSNAADSALYAQFHAEYLALGQRLKSQGLNSAQVAEQMNLNAPGTQASRVLTSFLQNKSDFGRSFNTTIGQSPTSPMAPGYKPNAPAIKVPGSDGLTIPRVNIQGRKPLGDILGGK